MAVISRISALVGQQVFDQREVGKVVLDVEDVVDAAERVPMSRRAAAVLVAPLAGDEFELALGARQFDPERRALARLALDADHARPSPR